MRVKPVIIIIFSFLILGVSSQRWGKFLWENEGSGDTWKKYTVKREANYKGADKYFHAQENYDAAQRGPGGALAAKVISDARKSEDIGPQVEDSMADQRANERGRSDKDPNHFRPAGLPDKH